MPNSHTHNRRRHFAGNALISLTITSLIFAAAIIALLYAAWYGMNSELCARNLGAAAYADMKLDCSLYER